jgi:hypothetical protein
LLLFTAFLPALAIMILLNNVAEEIGWGRIRLRPIPRSSWSAPRRLVDDSIFLAVPRTELQCRNAIMVDHGAGGFNVKTRSWPGTATVLLLLLQVLHRALSGMPVLRSGNQTSVAPLVSKLRALS